MNRKYSLSVLTALMCASLPAQAQDTAFQAETFEPRAAQRQNVLNVDTAEVLPHLTPSVGFFLHYINSPIQVVDSGTNEVVSQPVRRRLGADIGFGLGLGDRLELALTLPVALHQAGDLGFYNGGGALSSSAVGDIRFRPKFQVLGREENEAGLGLAFAGTLYLPTGDTGSFNGDGVPRVEPSFILDYVTEGGIRLTSNLGVQIRPRRNAISHISDDMVRYGLGTEVPLIEEKLSLEATAFGNVGLASSPTGNPFEVLGGVRWYASRNTLVQAGLGSGFNSGVGAGNVRVYAGMTYAPQATPCEVAPPSVEDCPKCPEVVEDVPPVKKPRVIVTSTHLAISEKVHFDTAKSVIKPRSYSLLLEVADALNDNPQITQIRVEGHTDWRSSKTSNQKLSERRAKSVVRFLIRKGQVDPKRLTAVGYGEGRPIASNKTTEGMAANRRVEFRIIELDGKAVAPTDTIVTDGEKTVQELQ
jgi:outer membrane protein OmpA-like peptidoglycan-associated protein